MATSTRQDLRMVSAQQTQSINDKYHAARHYQFLNLHPQTELDSVQLWFKEARTHFAEHERPKPLLLRGEKDSGRNYVLQAAAFNHHADNHPVIVIPFDLNTLHAESYQAQFNHMKLEVDNFEEQLSQSNTKLWPALKRFISEVSLQSSGIDGFGGLAFGITLGAFRYLLDLPPFMDSANNGGTASSIEELDIQLERQLEQLAKSYHIVLHFRQQEQMPTDLYAYLHRMCRRVCETLSDSEGFLSLAFSLQTNTPPFQAFGSKESYAELTVAPFTQTTIQRTLETRFGGTIAKPQFIKLLFDYAAYPSGQLSPKTIANLLNLLIEEEFIIYGDAQWVFTEKYSIAALKKLLGPHIEEHWHSTLSRLKSDKQRAFIGDFFFAAAIGGEWIPVNVLLDFFGIQEPDTRDNVIDLLDDHFVETTPQLLACLDFGVVGMGQIGKPQSSLVYRFNSPILPQLILASYSPSQIQTTAKELLSFLSEHWTSPHKNQAMYLLEIAKNAPHEQAKQWRERLIWWETVAFRKSLSEYIFIQLQRGELTPESLADILNKHPAWPAPQRDAFCKAWLRYYKSTQVIIAPDDADFIGEEWDELWESLDDSHIIPANEAGISFCYFKGKVFLDYAEYPLAIQLFERGLALCTKSPDTQMEAHFHFYIACIEYIKGKFDKAKDRLKEEVEPRYRTIGDNRHIATTKAKIADILQARGQLDEVLRILKQEVLPIFESLGDARSIAITQGQIADILQARGQLDEALHIRHEEQLPVYESLGEVRSIAITKGQIADILQTRGQLDEALRILKHEVLPILESLGDARSIAITQGKIADILQARGQLDEALHIRHEEQLPVYKSLGDVRSIAVTKGQIAGILFMNGEHDEAIQLYENEVLPIYGDLGDKQMLLVDNYV